MTRSIIAPALAFAALGSATAAQAQQQACVNPDDFADAIVYVMPAAYDATLTTCRERLSKEGFIARQGDAYIAQFRAVQEEAWPGAFRFIKTFMNEGSTGKGGKDADAAALVSALPENTLRPFVDAMVGQMIAKEIKPDTCPKIERGIELMSPLPADNVGGLLAFIVELAEIKNPPVCGAARKKR